MKKITIVYGTRPEFIKLYPLIQFLKQAEDINLQVISTGQHTDLLDTAHLEKSFVPDVNLNIKREHGDLNELQKLIFEKLHNLSITDKRPDLVVVHGDTATAFSTALFAFQFQVPIAHVESGLRSNNLGSPFPEEFYRQSISKMATLNFAPSDFEKENLIFEGISESRLFVVENTIIDSVSPIKKVKSKEKNNILITVHRRENRKHIEALLRRMNNLSILLDKSDFEYLLHPSVERMIDVNKYPNINFLTPMKHTQFLDYIQDCNFIVTDSGGVQEEATLLGVKTLIFRDHTERLDGLGEVVELLGTDLNRLSSRIIELANSPEVFKAKNQTSHKSVSEKITKIISDYLCSKRESICLF